MPSARQQIEPTQDILQTLRNCGGYYSCPKNLSGQRLGPLVGYAGHYLDTTGQRRQWVGDVYCNFAKAEQYPHVIKYFAWHLSFELEMLLKYSIDVFCGAPIGGYSFADMLGLVHNRRVIKAEKKITALATTTTREQSELAFVRHEIQVGEQVAIVEDVCNNFTTTQKLIDLIVLSGGQVTAIVCLLNRSLTVDTHYQLPESVTRLPIISLVRLPIPEYRQDDPEVAADIETGNVIWKPKDRWPELMAAMATQ